MTKFIVNDAAALRRALETTPWGNTTLTFGDTRVKFITCPMCWSYIPDSFTNQHETSATPRGVHIETHVAVALQLEHLENTIRYLTDTPT